MIVQKSRRIRVADEQAQLLTQGRAVTARVDREDAVFGGEIAEA
jgi:hypothetical protein